MEYRSPQAVDFNEVHELNKAFLLLLRDRQEAQSLLGGAAPEFADRLCRLRAAERRRLAAAPFLLFSLRERDESYWERVHAEAFVQDLFTTATPDSSTRGRLVAAALGFIWQMARRNPYTLRLICCASLYWCERLGEQPLMHLINRAATLDDVLELRAGSSADIWQRLLAGGIDGSEEVRLATYFSVLQTLLIRPDERRRAAWKSAACRTRLPSLKLDDGD